jgi:hypothetical protein
VTESAIEHVIFRICWCMIATLDNIWTTFMYIIKILIVNFGYKNIIYTLATHIVRTITIYVILFVSQKNFLSQLMLYT